MTHPELSQSTDLYQTFQQRVLEALTSVAGTTRTSEEWAELRAQAWAQQDLLEAAALTFTQHLLDPDSKEYDAGANQALKERMAQIVRNIEPTSATPADWARARSRAWVAYDLIEAAALTFAEYLLGKKAQPQHLMAA